jgi:hypothetical protein
VVHCEAAVPNRGLVQVELEVAMAMVLAELRGLRPGRHADSHVVDGGLVDADVALDGRGGERQQDGGRHGGVTARHAGEPSCLRTGEGLCRDELFEG